jgi:pyruvate dehydrogenase E2 component (dihydrolipoamide acetyltransferase)
VSKQPTEQLTEAEGVASPRARTLARERGIDLKQVKGSGPGGRIIERDLEQVSSQQQKEAPKPAGQDVPLSQMRKAVARITTQSKAPVPHFYVTIELDMVEGSRLVEEAKSAKIPISINHLIIAASARALKQHPGINAAFAGDNIRLFSSIDIGIAVALEEGLIVPVLRDCGAKSLQQIAEAERALIVRTRNRDLKPDEYMGATFLISNLGMYDVENFIAVILPPAAAALAIGSVREVPVIREGKVEVGRRLKMTLSCDHRVIDGAAAAKFLQTLKSALENPRGL